MNIEKIVKLSEKAIKDYSNEDYDSAYEPLIEILKSIKENPSLLKNIKEYEKLGSVLLMMLDQPITNDIDTLQVIASLGYVFTSKAIKQNPNNINLIKDRLLILRMGHEPFKYTVMNTLPKANPFSMRGSMSPNISRDSIYMMEISDLENTPSLCLNIPFFLERKNEFIAMNKNGFFLPKTKTSELVEEGKKMHEKIYNYLNDKIENNNIDF